MLHDFSSESSELERTRSLPSQKERAGADPADEAAFEHWIGSGFKLLQSEDYTVAKGPS